MNTFNETLFFDDISNIKSLCGEHDCNIKTICSKLGVSIVPKSSELRITGSNQSVLLAKKILQELYFILESGFRLKPVDVMHAIKMIEDDPDQSLTEVFLDTIIVSSKRKLITPKSFNQKKYVDSIRKSDIVIGIGPAGTGKTYLAMAMAISFLTKKYVDRIILTRPAIEAGEKLGFLPGDLFEKVNPYLRPLYDALHDIMEINKATELLHNGTIEVAPLAFMRGRTLNSSFVILDEAQNTTPEQMKMFLTRLGFNSKAVVTGDITQIDLPYGKDSGLITIKKILRNIKGIRFCSFSEKDVVRHPLVEEIIKAYEAAGKNDHKKT